MRDWSVPRILIAVSDCSDTIGICVNCLGAGFIALGPKSLIGVPPISKHRLVVPGNVKLSLSKLLSEFPAATCARIHERCAAIVLCGIIAKEGDSEVEPLVYRNKGCVSLEIKAISRERRKE